MNKNRNTTFSHLQNTSKAVPRGKYSNTGLSQETNKQTKQKKKKESYPMFMNWKH